MTRPVCRTRRCSVREQHDRPYLRNPLAAAVRVVLDLRTSRERHTLPVRFRHSAALRSGAALVSWYVLTTSGHANCHHARPPDDVPSIDAVVRVPGLFGRHCFCAEERVHVSPTHAPPRCRAARDLARSATSTDNIRTQESPPCGIPGRTTSKVLTPSAPVLVSGLTGRGTFYTFSVAHVH